MRDYKQIWQNVIDGLEKAYLPSSIQLWFGDSEIVLIDETKVVISILSILKIETVKRKYMDTMHTLFTKELGYDPEIILILPDEKSSYEKSENSIAPDKAAPRSIPSNAGGFSLSDINFEYTFENFSRNFKSVRSRCLHGGCEKSRNRLQSSFHLRLFWTRKNPPSQCDNE